MRGLVVIAGANPGVVLIRHTGTAELILLQGPADLPLHALESVEISAAGTIRKGPQGRTLTGVRDFEVVADSGRPARDGRLVKRVTSSSSWTLRVSRLVCRGHRRSCSDTLATGCGSRAMRLA